MTEAFGTLADRALQAAGSTPATVSTEPSTDDLDLRTLPARLDDAMLTRVRAIAEAPLPVYDSCSREHFDKCVKILALLPRKADDVTKGALRLEVYYRKLGGYPEAAWTYLADRGLDRFSFFPTVKECREVLEGWPVPNAARSRQGWARRKVEDEQIARLNDLAERIRRGELNGQQIDELPERVKAQLETRMVLLGRWDADAGVMKYLVRTGTL